MSFIEELRLVDARTFLERSHELYDELVRSIGASNAPVRYLRGQANCAFQLGRWGSFDGRWAGTLTALEQATSEYQALTVRFPDDIDLWVALADCHYLTAQYLGMFVDRSHARRLGHVRHAKAIYKRLARENPTVTRIRSGWALCIVGRSNESRPGETREERQAALHEIEHCLTISRRLVADDKDVPLHVGLLGTSLWMYGAILFEVGRRDEAIADLREACDVLERSDFTRSSFSYQRGRLDLIQASLALSVDLAIAGRRDQALTAIRKMIAMDEAYKGPRESYGVVSNMARCHMLRSFLALGAGLKEEATESVERAATLLEPLTNPTALETWDLAALEMLWVANGRRASPNHPAEPPGRPEHAARAVTLLRQASDRGYTDVSNTAAFFGPVVGSLPEFQQLMMDLPFPADPFQPLPETEGDGPLSASADTRA